VKIWYDVSDLVGWDLPHLTGIQRTTVGILNGLVEQGSSVGLVRYEVKSGQFFAMRVTELPATVRCHLRGFATEPGAAEDAAAGRGTPAARNAAGRPTRRRLKLFKKDFLFGSSGEAGELRQSFRQFKTAARQLRKSIGRWARQRLRRAAHSRNRAVPPAGMRAATLPGEKPRADVATFIMAGDVFVSTGATWMMPGHVEAVAGIRNRGVKVMRMIYDLIPTIKPQWLEPSHTKQITAWVRSVLRESDSVLTISQFSRQEIERYCAECRFEVPAITVVRLGDVLDQGTGTETLSPLPRFAPTRPFFVCVSTLDVRKNHRLLYDAWTQLAVRRGDGCPDLVCIGTPHLYVADLLREIRQDRTVNRHIHVLHGIEDCELKWYYKNCQSTIYPSKYEGWGLPVAESLGHGRMCLASHATSIPEISSDLPAFFDPYDVHGLVTLIEQVLDDPEWVHGHEERIRRNFRPTSWRETAAQVLGAIHASSEQGSRSVCPRMSCENEAAKPAVADSSGTSKAA